MNKITKDGKLVELRDENDETVVNIQELKQMQKNINGNPDMKEMLGQIIGYLETEG